MQFVIRLNMIRLTMITLTMIQSLRLMAERGRTVICLCSLAACFALAANAQPMVLQCDTAQTTAKFTLGDVLHTVHGAFKVNIAQE